jgi:hypothetical protein
MLTDQIYLAGSISGGAVWPPLSNSVACRRLSAASALRLRKKSSIVPFARNRFCGGGAASLLEALWYLKVKVALARRPMRRNERPIILFQLPAEVADGNSDGYE